MIANKFPIQNPNERFDAQLTLGERIADSVASFGGSWTFILCFIGGMAVWMAWNEIGGTRFDPYPFILLNLVLSCVAALQAPFIMMSQNRLAEKDRMDAQHDYEVNVRAEMEIVELRTKLDALREYELLWMREELARQRELLARMEGLLLAQLPGRAEDEEMGRAD